MAAVAAIGTALAASHGNHVMKVALPDGTVARIEYEGDVAPKVTVTTAFAVQFVFDELAAAPFLAG